MVFAWYNSNWLTNSVLARSNYAKSADLSELGLKVAIFALLSELTQYNTLGYYESLNYVKVQIWVNTDLKGPFSLDTSYWLRKIVLVTMKSVPLLKWLIWVRRHLKWYLELTQKRTFGKKKVCTYAKRADLASI